MGINAQHSIGHNWMFMEWLNMPRMKYQVVNAICVNFNWFQTYKKLQSGTKKFLHISTQIGT